MTDVTTGLRLDVTADVDGIHVAGHPDIPTDISAPALLRLAAAAGVTVIRVDVTGLGWGLAARLRTAADCIDDPTPAIVDYAPAAARKNMITLPVPAGSLVTSTSIDPRHHLTETRIVCPGPNGEPAVTIRLDHHTGRWTADYDPDKTDDALATFLDALNRWALVPAAAAVPAPDLPAVPTADDMAATPGLRPPPGIVAGLAVSMRSAVTQSDRRTAEAWLNIASWMVAAEYTDDQAHRVADEVAWRVTRCGMTHPEAMESVWADICARRLRIGPA